MKYEFWNLLSDCRAFKLHRLEDFRLDEANRACAGPVGNFSATGYNVAPRPNH
jgi:hypothetical protein